jgi:type IV secretion system protein TrbL
MWVKNMPLPAHKLVKYLLFSAVLMSASAELYAQTPPDVLDGMLSGYKSASSSWLGKIEPIARSLFWKLAAIEFAWSTIVWALQQDQMQSFVASVVKKLIGIGFFYALLLNASSWMPAIVDGFTEAGKQASGVGSLTPSLVFDRGIDVANAVLSGVGVLGVLKNPIVSIVAGWAAIFIVIAFIIIAGQLLVTLIESYIVITAGVLFLGFGGSRWTTDLAQKYISYAVATGVKLFMIYLIIGVALAQSATWAALLATASFTNIFVVLGASVLLAFLAFQIPNMAASMLSGAPSLTAGAAVGAAGAMAAGTVAAGASVISPAMQGARGGMQALKAGYDHHRAAGGGRLASALKAVGTSTVDYGREAGRSAGEAVGLARPTTSQATTIGGRAAEGRQSATDVMREQQAAGAGQMGSARNTSASNTSEGNSSAPSGEQPVGAAPSSSPQFPAFGTGPGASPTPTMTTRQAGDKMVDNAPGKLGSAAAQTTATNTADTNQAVAGLTSAAAPTVASAALEGAQHKAATATAMQAGATRQASDSMVDNAPGKLGSAAAQTTATNTSASNPSAAPMKTTDAADATWNSDAAEVRAATGARGTQPPRQGQVQEKRIFSDLHQVRPPNIPNDAAPQAGVNFRISHTDD